MLLYIFDVVGVTLGVVFIIMAIWVAICAIALSLHSWYTHLVETNHRLMHRFAETTNYPMYQKYQERNIVAARRLARLERFLNIITFC